MGEARQGGAQRLEYLNLRRGVGYMILAAQNVRDFELRVVHYRGHGVEKTSILADQDRIGQSRGVDFDGTADQIVPFYLVVAEPEAPIRSASLDGEFLALRVGQVERGAVIDGWLALSHLALAPTVEFRCRL